MNRIMLEEETDSGNTEKVKIVDVCMSLFTSP